MKKIFLLAFLAIGFSTNSKALETISCGNGDLVVAQDLENSPYFTATITSQFVIEYFLGESRMETSGTDSAGAPFTSKKELPFSVKISGPNGKRKMVISQMTKSHTNPQDFSTGGPIGASLRSWAYGYDLVMVGGKMTSSHSLALWHVGKWWFDSCQ